MFHCTTFPSLQLFKGVAERGKWTRALEDAEMSYEEGDLDSALMVYLLLAEMGVEVAQTNAAYILEQGHYNCIPFMCTSVAVALISVTYISQTSKYF